MVRQIGTITDFSCTLLRAAWQAHAECTPKIGSADLGNTPPSLPDSLGRHSE